MVAWVLGLAACKDKGSDAPSVVDDTGPTVVDTQTDGVVTHPVTCADPSARAAAPFDRVEIPDPPNDDVWLWSGGLAIGDLDGDAHLDLVTPTQPDLRIQRYDPIAGGFAASAGAPAGIDFGVGGSVADYDGDGDLDLYVTRFERPNVLLQNQGDGTWIDVTAIAGVGGGDDRTLASAWADYDRDGDLDLFVGNYGWVDESGTLSQDFLPGDPSFLYRNDGDGTFADVTDLIGFPAVLEGYTYVGTWFDPNNDGWPDLYIVNDFGNATPNLLLWNRGGTFEADDGSAGLNLNMSGMGLGLGDTDEDGTFDLLIPQWEDLWFLQGNDIALSDGSSLQFWVDRSDVVGMRQNYETGQRIGWGAELADLDNDADLDAPVAFGFIANDNPRWKNPQEEPDALFLRSNIDDTYEDVAVAWGIADAGASRGFSVVDFNDDGWLDIVKRDVMGNTVVYTSRCGAEAWLRFRLHAPGTMNPGAVGAKIEVTAGDHHLVRIVLAGSTIHATGGPPEVHFGLGDAEVVESVVITWPDGEVTALDDLATRQIVDVTR